MALAWFARGNGASFGGLSYDLLALFAGLVIAGLNGAGTNLIPGSPLATAQVYAVFSTQIGVSLYVAVVKPSADRIDNWLTALQFLVEGSQTGVLILGASYATRGNTNSALSCQAAAFFLGLAALFLPLFEKVYNAVIHPMSACYRGEFDPRTFFFAFVSLLMSIPGAVINILGIDNVELDDAMGGAEEGLALAEEAVDVMEGVGDQLEDLAAGLADLGSNVAGDLHWMTQAKRAEKRGKVGKRSWKGLMFRIRRPKATKPTPEGKEELPSEGKEELGSQADRKEELPAEAAEAAEEKGKSVYESVSQLAPGVTSTLDKPYRSVDVDWYSMDYSMDAAAAQDYSVSQCDSPKRGSRRRSRASTGYSVDPAYVPQYLGPVKVTKAHRRMSAQPSEPLGIELVTDDRGRIVTVSVTAGSRAAQAGIPVRAQGWWM